MNYTTDVRDLTQQLDTLAAKADADIDSRDAQIATQQATITALQQQISDLQAQVPAQRTVTLFGVCLPQTGGVATLDRKYGLKVPVVRQFAAASQPKPAASDRPILLDTKLKPDAAGLGDWLATYPPGTVVSVFHEIDAHTDIYPAAQFTADFRKMAPIIRTAGHQTMLCVTAWEFDPRSGRHIADVWPGDDVVDMLGVDFDAYKLPSTGYPDFTAPLGNVVAFTQAHGKPWSVCELAAGRRDDDPDGTGRATWLIHCAQAFSSAGARHVCLFDYPDSRFPNQPLTTPAEIAACKALLG